MSAEMNFLLWLQTAHRDWLTPVMIFITELGNAGFIWILTGVILLIPEKTRKCGAVMLAALAFSFLTGNLIIKNLVGRERPFIRNGAVPLLIPAPSGFSFPSGHTLSSFTAATVLFLFHKGAGTGAYILAALIAFSRMYLFVHFPTDILAGILLGVLDGALVFLAMRRAERKVDKR